MALNICELWPNGIKIASFPKNYEKLAQRLGLRLQTPICDTFQLHKLAQYVSQFLHFCFCGGLSPLPIAKSWLNVSTQPTASDLPIYNLFVSQKVPLWKISDDVIACNLWFWPRPQSKVLATPMNKNLHWCLFWSSMQRGENFFSCLQCLSLKEKIDNRLSDLLQPTFFGRVKI